MITSILGILGALLTILGPAFAAGLLAWYDKKQTEQAHEAIDEADTYINEYHGGNRAGLINLSRQLERLRREASRKRGDS